jgi:nicotinamidase-related amidase
MSGVGRPVNEAEWQDQVIGTARDHEGVAIRFGWHVLHLRPGRTAHGWRTPVQGDMGKGWPDLILVRGERILAAELKAEGKRTTPEQDAVLALLERCGVEVYVWRPSDLTAVIEALR